MELFNGFETTPMQRFRLAPGDGHDDSFDMPTRLLVRQERGVLTRDGRYPDRLAHREGVVYRRDETGGSGELRFTETLLS